MRVVAVRGIKLRAAAVKPELARCKLEEISIRQKAGIRTRGKWPVEMRLPAGLRMPNKLELAASTNTPEKIEDGSRSRKGIQANRKSEEILSRVAMYKPEQEEAEEEGITPGNL